MLRRRGPEAVVRFGGYHYVGGRMKSPELNGGNNVIRTSLILEAA
jgi:UDP-glucose 4-epimerase